MWFEWKFDGPCGYFECIVSFSLPRRLNIWQCLAEKNRISVSAWTKKNLIRTNQLHFDLFWTIKKYYNLTISFVSLIFPHKGWQFNRWIGFEEYMHNPSFMLHLLFFDTLMLSCKFWSQSEVLGLKVIFSRFSLYDLFCPCVFEKAQFKNRSFLLPQLCLFKP